MANLKEILEQLPFDARALKELTSYAQPPFAHRGQVLPSGGEHDTHLKVLELAGSKGGSM
eukprot:CAMPEP_0115128280 /NCGR_PEP_ID=MMETSP0227-20121206/51010_1 /TAXON_ID=89957 /ORGANISM="Polarella glacialis, Strain CCMP 1383" /LENGTH=59 /DNA_ID=CAMNT_0002532745 /DNA_START=946 /DNA_END=1126 /DNA_ORIENTATION=+